MRWAVALLLTVLMMGGVRANSNQEPSAVTGRVLTPDGKPAAQAKVWLVVNRWENEHPTVESLTLTDSQGHFRLPYKTPLRVRYAVVVVHRPEFAVGWRHFDPREVKPLTVRLNQSAPLTGIVLTPDGKPLAGVKVRLRSLMTSTPPVPMLKVLRREREREDRWLEPMPEEVTPFWTATDVEGRFVFDSLPANFTVTLVVEHPNFAKTFLPPPEFRSIPTGTGNIVLVMSPKSFLQGQLLAGDKPIAGQVICRGYFSDGEGKHQLTTDGQGRIECALSPGQWFIWAVAEGGKWQCEPQVIVLAPNNTTTVTFQLVRAVEVRGTVIDAQTKKPVPFAEVYADRLVTIRLNIAGYLEEVRDWWRPQVVKADEQGNFRLFLLPGKWTLNSWASYKPDHRIEARMESEIANDMAVTLELSEQKQPTVQVQVVDEKGKPVPKAIVTDEWTTRQADERGWAELPSFSPRPILAATPDLTAFGEAEVKSATKSVRIVVRKGVPVGGQVADENGKTVPKARLLVSALRYEPQINHEMPSDWFEVVADEKGRFQFFLPAGQKARLIVFASGFFPTPTEPFTPDPAKPITLKVQMKRPDFTYEATVVDAQTGQPVYGAAVSLWLSLPGGFSVSEQQNLFTLTDRQGRFRLTGLRREHLGRLMVFHPAYKPFQTFLLVKNIPSRIELERFPVGAQLVVGEPAPPLSDVRWLDGDAPSLQGKTTYLLFAMPFDPGCERVMERFKELQAKEPDKTQVIVVFDASLPADELRRHAREMGLPFRIGTVPEGRLSGWDSETFQRYAVKSVPFLVVINEQGLVQAINPE